MITKLWLCGNIHRSGTRHGYQNRRGFITYAWLSRKLYFFKAFNTQYNRTEGRDSHAKGISTMFLHLENILYKAFRGKTQFNKYFHFLKCVCEKNLYTRLFMWIVKRGKKMKYKINLLHILHILVHYFKTLSQIIFFFETFHKKRYE